MAAVYAARYARALLDLLEPSGDQAQAGLTVEAASGQLGDFAAAWDESAALRSVFLDPSYNAEKKIALLDKLNDRLGMARPVRNFLAVILRHERMEGFRDIVSEFHRMVRGDQGIDKVVWTSARPLSQDERQAVASRIAELTGKRVEASFVEDPTLLGGARLAVGSTIYDGSVRGRLDQLKETLAAR